VTVGASSRDFEITRENRTWQANYYFVANFEIARATNNAANIGATVSCFLTGISNTNLAPANCLAVGLWFLNEFKNFTDHNWSGDFETVRAFLFKTNFYKFGHHVFRSGTRWQINILSKP
jgi:hypothetical protein